MFPQICDLAQLSIAILKYHMSLDLDHVMNLSGSLSFNLNILREEECSYLEWDALRHVAHNELDIICNRSTLTLQCLLPIYSINVPFSRVKVFLEGEILMEHSQEWARSYHYKLI